MDSRVAVVQVIAVRSDRFSHDLGFVMTPAQTAVPTARTVRLIHASMITGVLLFALVSHFVLRRTVAGAGSFSPNVVSALLGLAFVLCGASLLLLQRMPRRSTDESADLFWVRGSAPAIVTWAPVEGASLLAVFLYGQTGSPVAIVVAAIALVIFLRLNPAFLERR